MLLRLPPDIHDALTRLRTERHVNISAWVRATLKSALEHEGMLIGTGATHTPRAGCKPAPRMEAPPPEQWRLGLHLPRRYLRAAL